MLDLASTASITPGATPSPAGNRGLQALGSLSDPLPSRRGTALGPAGEEQGGCAASPQRGTVHPEMARAEVAALAIPAEEMGKNNTVRERKKAAAV